MNKTQFYLHFDTMPTTTSQQKGVRVVNGKPYFYTKAKVTEAMKEFGVELRKYRPSTPIDRPVRLYLWFAFDVKDKKKWGKYRPTKPDVDNIAKTFIDSMVHNGFFEDDALVADLRVIKTYAEEASVMVQYEVIDQ